MSYEVRLISFVKERLGIDREKEMRLCPLSLRGSERRFYRIILNGDNSFILIHYNPTRIENTYYGDIANFLYRIGVPAPRVLAHDRDMCLMVLEDLGDIDLYTLKDSPWDVRRTLYEKTIVAIYRLHSYPKDGVHLKGLTLMAPFDAHLYRWEQNYFLEEFVEGISGVVLEEGLKKELDREFFKLTEGIIASGLCLIHRDLQSQNVMVREGSPFFIDFQGIRFGSLFYDLGSFLFDPYVSFRKEEFESLLHFSLELWRERFAEEVFRDHFFSASCQRLMQALGAYGYLGSKKGLKGYLSYIPQGIENLERALSATLRYPRLSEVVTRCKGMLDHNSIQK
ncbi:MAG: phosphotransferase [Syntrophorhabdaceae bacterium]|nr:phosphotransferase [Syntrophorhabdaceae bacterium]